jgi:uncharacterized protein YceK
MKPLLLAVAVVSLAGCASAPKNIAPEQQVPGAYSNYGCDSLYMERTNRQSELDRQVRSQKKQHITDLATFWTGMVIAWPAIFVPIFTPDYSDEIADNRGKLQALDIQLVKKECG